MLSPTHFRDIVSGRRRGLGAGLLRAALGAAEIPYALYMRRRNRRYDSGQASVERVGVPVVSIGNLTVGGTGKTPLVEWLARWCQQRAYRVAIVSRGYGSKAGKPNDEALELAQKLPGVPHVQNANRAAAAREAIDKHQAQLILLDDAFQHRRLHRDLDIVLLDALEPLGYGRLLPRGLLREPIEGLARAHVVGLSRADLIEPAEREAIRAKVAELAPRATWIELAHRPISLLSASGEEAPLAALAGREVAAFCGIGNPAGFRRTLESCGLRTCAWREFPDHYSYGSRDLDALAAWVDASPAEVAVCTQKDLVKLNRRELAGKPLWALRIDLELLTGKSELDERLNGLLTPAQ